MSSGRQKLNSDHRGDRWTARELKLLGKLPDSVLARRTGRTIKEIVAEREARRIRVPAGSRRWTANEIKLLENSATLNWPVGLRARSGKCESSGWSVKYRHSSPAREISVSGHSKKSGFWEQCLTPSWPADSNAALARFNRNDSSWESRMSVPNSNLGLVRRNNYRAQSPMRRLRASLGGRVWPWPHEEFKCAGRRCRILIRNSGLGHRRRKNCRLSLPSMKMLAQATDATANAVEARRISRQIPKYASRLHYWSPEEDELLGQMPDEQVARQLRVTLVAVQVRRFKLGRLKPDSKHRRWTAEEDALLGTLPDEDVAKRTGHPLGSVRVRRASLGIANPTPPACPPYTPEEDSWLGKETDKEVALRLGRSVSSVKNRRALLKIPAKIAARPRLSFTPAQDRLLGTAPDAEVAARLKRGIWPVIERRQELGIPPFGSKRRLWSTEEDALLGTMPDAELARHLTRSYEAVAQRRINKGIPPNKPKRKTWSLKTGSATEFNLPQRLAGEKARTTGESEIARTETTRLITAETGRISALYVLRLNRIGAARHSYLRKECGHRAARSRAPRHSWG